MPVTRCLVDPDTCSWTYAHERLVVVEAAWREHYAAHERGARCHEDYARTGTVHPLPQLEGRYSANRRSQPHTDKDSPP